MSESKTKSYNTIFAGLFAGSVSVIGSYPFDLIKTRVQIYTKQNLSTITNIKNIYNEGYLINKYRYNWLSGFLNYYRGVEYTLPGGALKSIIRFYTFDKTVDLYKKYIIKGTDTQLKVHQNLLCGTMAGLIETILVVQPSERGKTLKITYSNPINMLKQTMLNNGISATISTIYKGFYPTLFRQVGNQATAFATFYEGKNRLLQYNGRKELGNIESLSLGFMSGLAACIMTMPFDVTKSLIQADTSNKKITMLTAMKLIYKNQGIKGLYVGANMRMMRVGLDRAFMFWGYDLIIRTLSK